MRWWFLFLLLPAVLIAQTGRLITDDKWSKTEWEKLSRDQKRTEVQELSPRKGERFSDRQVERWRKLFLVFPSATNWNCNGNVMATVETQSGQHVICADNFSSRELWPCVPASVWLQDPVWIDFRGKTNAATVKP